MRSPKAAAANHAPIVWGALLALDALCVCDLARATNFSEVVLMTLPSSGYSYGVSSAGIGDLNGDGVADIVARSPAVTEGLNVFWGSANPDTIADLAIPTPLLPPAAGGGPVPGFGVGILVYDINGDHIDDLLVGGLGWRADTASPQTGRAYIYFGGVPFDAEIDFEIPSPPTNWFGLGITAAGDFNADGFNDFIVNGNDTGYLVYGGQPLTGIMQHDAVGLVGGGDWNKDGHPDLVGVYRIGFSYPLKVHYGGPGADFVFDVEIPGFNEYARPLLADVNADGIDDLLVFDAPFVSTEVYYGSNSPDIVADQNLQDIAPLFDAGDLNSDGFDDLIVHGGILLGGSPTDPTVDFPMAQPLSHWGAGDVNGDGARDYLIAGKDPTPPDDGSSLYSATRPDDFVLS